MIPVVIAQHMPQFFTACLADSLTQDAGLAVEEGAHRGPLLPPFPLRPETARRRLGGSAHCGGGDPSGR